MHEFSICQNIIQIVDQKLNQVSQTRVEKIILTIGKLAAIDIESLKFWFPVAVKSTSLDSATIEVTEIEGSAQCISCHQQFDLEKLYQACPFCNSYDRKILSGMEMLVQKIQLK
ncbi:MAG: hydrogenase maturation nickel metallochaperone HypA [Gammaproteobacteria bacterium]|nr:MAG: hydrogenase maturation nickel metallochaperone HypA [Gammaproteobacteria bacterium]UTW41774.1 hydrogenase maturation nickel metallochaperone HypA [bacterium SCSIO 12844]